MTVASYRQMGHRLEGEPKDVTQEKMSRFERIAGMAAGEHETGQPVNIHTDTDKARGMGLERPVASGQMSFAYIHEILAREFGADFRQGGELAVTFLKPLYAGDVVTAKGEVTAREQLGGRTRWTLRVWVENQRGNRTCGGEAQVVTPSPLT